MKLSNGSLTGALGNLQRRKSDIALTAFFMKVSEMEVEIETMVDLSREEKK